MPELQTVSTKAGTGGERSSGPPLPSLIRPMRSANVPLIDARYWAAITLASAFGCNLGDCLSFYAGWNHWIGLLPLTVLFAALLSGERRSTRGTQAWYWTIVIVLRAAATNLADLATHTFQWPYPRVILGLLVLQALVIWRIPSKRLADTPDPSAMPQAPNTSGKRKGPVITGRPITGSWYWLSLLTAGTLGTAIGDYVAEDLHLGTGYGTLLLGMLFAVVLTAGSRSRWTTRTSYWLAIIAVRAAGTTAGDWLAFREEPGLRSGLHLGLPLSTTLTCILFVGVLVLWKPQPTRAPSFLKQPS